MKTIPRKLALGIMAIILLIALIIPTVPALAYSQSTTSTIGSQTDNCVVWYNGSQWTISTTPTALQAGYHSAPYQRMSSGMRFLNIQIPYGATITQAYLRFTAYSDSGTFTNIPVVTTITGQLSSYPQPFSTYLDYTNRPRTSNTVDWDINQTWSSGQAIQSPDISYVVQEMVQRSDWYQGASVVLFWGDINGLTTQQNGYCRRIYPYGQGTPPTLYISYTYSGNTDNTGSGNVDLSSVTAQLNTMTTTLTQLQTQLATVATSTQGNTSSIATINGKLDTMTGTQANAVSQAVTNSLTNNQQLKELGVQITNFNTQANQLNANLRVVSDKQDAIQKQLTDLAKKDSSGLLYVVIVIGVINLLLVFLLFAALRRQQSS